MPSRVTQCKEEGCDLAPMPGAHFCGTHIGAKRRCKATRAGSKGTQRCKKPAMPGLDVCAKHGGRFPNAKAMSKRAEALTEMQRFVKPYEGELDPIRAFEMEFRRTLGRIAWYDEQLSLLETAEDLIWGKSKEEHINAGSGEDFHPGVNTTYEAKVNILESLQFKERRHLLDLEKVWIGAGLEQQRLNMLATYVEKTMRLTEQALDQLGIDTSAPEVRAVLTQVFLGDAPPPPHIDVRQIGVHGA